MIDHEWIDQHNHRSQPGVIGTLTIGGFPGHYTLRVGLTGPVIASGSMGEIQSALGYILKPAQRRESAPPMPGENRITLRVTTEENAEIIEVVSGKNPMAVENAATDLARSYERSGCLVERI